MGDSIGWAQRLVVSGDGKNLVSHAGAAALRLLSDKTGLTGAFSAALARGGFAPAHDRGRVFTDLAVSIADGSTTIGGIDVLAPVRRAVRERRVRADRMAVPGRDRRAADPRARRGDRENPAARVETHRRPARVAATDPHRRPPRR